MNSLSWLVYLIGLVSKVDTMTSIILFISVISFIVFLLISGAMWSEAYKPEEQKWVTKFFRKSMFTIITIFIVTTIVNIAVPDRKTMILIAASEVGERVVNSEKMGKITSDVLDPSIDLLKNWIKKETESLKEKVEEKKKGG